MTISSRFPWCYTRTRMLMRLPNAGKLLDVGCGSGDLLRLVKTLKPGLAQHGTDVYRDAKLPRSVHFFTSNANEKLNAPDNAYDAVISTHVFEHLEHPERAMAEVFRVLKPGGKVYIETPSPRSLALPSFRSVNIRENVPINFYDDPTHLRPFSARALYQLCTTAGLRVRSAGNVRNWLGVLTAPVTFLLAFILQKRSFLVHSVWNVFGWSSYAVAEKPRTR